VVPVRTGLCRAPLVEAAARPGPASTASAERALSQPPPKAPGEDTPVAMILTHSPDPEIAALERLVAGHGGKVFCHVPASEPFELEALARPDDGEDRWGVPGLRTAYLASDPAIAVAEYARHHDPAGPPEERRIFRLNLRELPMLDVRQPRAVAALGLGTVSEFADRALARRVARLVREAGICQGLVTPSVAFLDQPERSNVVIFCDGEASAIGSVLADPQPMGRLALDPA
jgi:RES domain-containing protein